MFDSVPAFLTDDTGATAIEYGLIAALVSLAGMAALSSAGESLKGIFNNVSSHMDSAAG